MTRIVVFLVLTFVVMTVLHADMLENSTKHVFKSNLDDNRKQELLGVGVRVKTIGPIRAKVYSVGLYLDRALAAARLTQRGFSDTDEKQLAGNSEFEQELIKGAFGKSLVLRMARDVGTSKMVDALGESVRPRIKGDDAALAQFQQLLSDALEEGEGGARNNMLFKFEAPAALNSLSVSVDGLLRGAVHSPALVRALFGVYLDRDSVSPSLKTSIARTLPSWLRQKQQ